MSTWLRYVYLALGVAMLAWSVKTKWEGTKALCWIGAVFTIGLPIIDAILWWTW